MSDRPALADTPHSDRRFEAPEGGAMDRQASGTPTGGAKRRRKER